MLVKQSEDTVFGVSAKGWIPKVRGDVRHHMEIAHFN